MTTAVQVAIAGEAAEPAVSELMGIPGLSVSYEAQTQKEGTLAVIATIVGIAGGTVALAEQIRKWYLEWKQSQSGETFDVVIQSPTGRIVLEDCTIEDICQVLKALERSLELQRRIGNVQGEAATLHQLAIIHTQPGDFHFQKIYQNKSKTFADQNRFFASFNSLYSKIFLTPTLCLFYGCKKAEPLADS